MSTRYQECVDECLACMKACNFCFNACLIDDRMEPFAHCAQRSVVFVVSNV